MNQIRLQAYRTLDRFPRPYNVYYIILDAKQIDELKTSLLLLNADEVVYRKFRTFKLEKLTPNSAIGCSIPVTKNTAIYGDLLTSPYISGLEFIADWRLYTGEVLPF